MEETDSVSSFVLDRTHLVRIKPYRHRHYSFIVFDDHVMVCTHQDYLLRRRFLERMAWVAGRAAGSARSCLKALLVDKNFPNL